MYLNITEPLLFDEEKEFSLSRAIGIPVDANYQKQRDEDDLKEYFPNLDLLNDIQYCQNVLKSDGYLLRLINDKFKDDHNTVFIAINNCPDSIEFASKRLKNDPRLITSLIKRGYGYCITYVSDNLKNDKNLAQLIIKDDPHNFDAFSLNLRSDIDLVISALNKGFLFKYAADCLKDDELIAIKLLQNVQLNENMWNNFSNRIRKIIGKTLDNNAAINALNSKLEADQLNTHLSKSTQSINSKLKL